MLMIINLYSAVRL